MKTNYVKFDQQKDFYLLYGYTKNNLSKELTVVFGADEADHYARWLMSEPIIKLSDVLNICGIHYDKRDKKTFEKMGYTRDQIFNSFRKRKIKPVGLCGAHIEVVFPKPIELTWKVIGEAYNKLSKGS